MQMIVLNIPESEEATKSESDMDMEKKLAEFRARKARERKMNELKSRMMSPFERFFRRNEAKDVKTVPTREQLQQQKPLISEKSEDLETSDPIHEDNRSVQSETEIDDNNLQCCTYSDLFYYFSCFMCWASLYAMFIRWQFGTVYLIVSAMILMYLNTRTGPRRSDEVSAYSVFNKDCKSIDGALRAEQFENELRYGAGTVR